MNPINHLFNVVRTLYTNAAAQSDLTYSFINVSLSLHLILWSRILQIYWLTGSYSLLRVNDLSFWQEKRSWHTWGMISQELLSGNSLRYRIDKTFCGEIKVCLFRCNTATYRSCHFSFTHLSLWSLDLYYFQGIEAPGGLKYVLPGVSRLAFQKGVDVHFVQANFHYSSLSFRTVYP